MPCFPSISLFVKGILRHLSLPTNIHFTTLLSSHLPWMSTFHSNHILLSSSKTYDFFFSLSDFIFPVNSISVIFFYHTFA